jgi:hypothetical protein
VSCFALHFVIFHLHFVVLIWLNAKWMIWLTTKWFIQMKSFNTNSSIQIISVNMTWFIETI